jgi:glyoxylase-like metal-dependent hydrolase (beta-lactamase superfamily II)
MKINKVEVGILQTNCYVLNKNNETLIIDPGDEYEKIMKYVDGNIVGIIITHHHFDHVGALSYFKDIKVYDISNLKEGINNISSFKFEMIKTPGHTSDLISILIDNNLFCGDFIFKGTIGRYDLETSSITDMKNSINKILKYDDDIVIYPGHGDITTLKEERNNIKYYL